MKYEMRELIPVVAWLTDRYTSKESSSVTYEKAGQLMEAVLFCIRENEMVQEEKEITGSLLLREEEWSAQEAYEAGYEKVLQKVQLVRELFNRTSGSFCAYGNLNYRDTFEGGIPGFLKVYDARFFPQNPVITMDYPILKRLNDLQGVDEVYEYLQCICLEQLFLNRLPAESIREVLEQYHSDYANLYCNICNLILRDLLKCMMSGKNVSHKIYTTNEREQLIAQVHSSGKQELVEKLTALLRILIQEQYGGNSGLFRYLSYDLEDFAVELRLAEELNLL